MSLMAPRLLKGLLASDPASGSLSSFRMLLLKEIRMRPSSAQNPAGLPTHPGEAQVLTTAPQGLPSSNLPCPPPDPTPPQLTLSAPASPPPPCFSHTDLFAIPGTQTARSCFRNRDSVAPLAQSTLRRLGSCQAPSLSLDPDSTVLFLGQASLMTLFNMICSGLPWESSG